MDTYTGSQLKNMDDDSLISLVKKKNDAAFEVLASRYIGLISSIASKYENIQMNSQYDRDDFIQVGLLGLLSACMKYEKGKGASFKNYAVICAENNYKSIIRNLHGKSRIPAKSITPIDECSEDYTDVTQEDMQESVEIREYIQSLHDRLKKELSTFEYTVISLRLEGMSCRKIAEKLGRDEKSVNNAIHRAYSKLQSKKD